MPDKNYAVMVNSSGKVMKNTTVKNSDDIKYKTNSSGQVTEIDGESVSGVMGVDPEEPDYLADDWYSKYPGRLFQPTAFQKASASAGAVFAKEDIWPDINAV